MSWSPRKNIHKAYITCGSAGQSHEIFRPLSSRDSGLWQFLNPCSPAPPSALRKVCKGCTLGSFYKHPKSSREYLFKSRKIPCPSAALLVENGFIVLLPIRDYLLEIHPSSYYREIVQGLRYYRFSPMMHARTVLFLKKYSVTYGCFFAVVSSFAFIAVFHFIFIVLFILMGTHMPLSGPGFSILQMTLKL